MGDGRRGGVAVLVAGYPPAYLGGGPIRTIEAMVETRVGTGPVWVVTSAYDQGHPLPNVLGGSWQRVGRACVYYGETRSFIGVIATYQALRTRRARTLYLNSLFSTWFAIVPLLLCKFRYLRFERVCLAPRGELDPGAIRLSPTKKRIYLAAARLVGLHSAVLWHASSEMEAADIRRVFPCAQIVVKENETLIRPTVVEDIAERGDVFQLVYVGRISPKKQVHLLVQALARVAERRDFELTIYGDGEPAYIRTCQAYAQALGRSVHFKGSIEHEDVAGAFAAADFACFPTAGENFGHVIPEALAQGCPVLIADVTPWTERVRRGGGIIVSSPAGVDEWVHALESAHSLTKDQRIVRRHAALASFRDWAGKRDQRSFLDIVSVL